MKRLTLTMSIMLFFISTIAVACEPPTKKAYLENFKEFVDRIDETHKDMSNSDWKKAKEHYDKFNGEWYEKFKDKLTQEEKDKILLYKSDFKFHYTLHKASNSLNELLNSETTKENIRELKSEIDNLLSEIKNEDNATELENIIEEKVKEIATFFESREDNYEESIEQFTQKASEAIDKFIQFTRTLE